MLMPDARRCIIKWRALGSKRRIGQVPRMIHRACSFFGAILFSILKT
jgi:hypothetical protein